MKVEESTVLFICGIICFVICGSMSSSGEMGPNCHPNLKIITCEQKFPCIASLCPKITPDMCPSGCVTKCGCCVICLEYYYIGEQCRFLLPTNAICAPGLYCGSRGVCAPKDNTNECREYLREHQKFYDASLRY